MSEFTNPPINKNHADSTRADKPAQADRPAIRREYPETIMKYSFTPYVHGIEAFREVERFLGESHARYAHPRNWQIDRWNFTFTVSRIMHGESIENWERRIGLWRDERGRIACMAHEEEQRGDVFFEFTSPEAESEAPIDDMLDFAETVCALPRNGGTGFGLRVPTDDAFLAGIIARRGYAKADWSEPLSVRSIDWSRADAPSAPAASSTAADLTLVSGDVVDPAKKAIAHARAFGYADSSPERIPLSVAAFAELRNAPSYRGELDLAWQNGTGDIVSFVGLWFDPVSRLAILEPVGTIPAYRRKRLAERLIAEGSRSVAALGAKALYVGSDQAFYRAIGFEVVISQNVWEYRR